MPSYWDKRPGDAKNLRLLTASGMWRQWSDEVSDDAPGPPTPATGAKKRIVDALQQALHSTNVMVLLGSGASFGASNESGVRAPGMKDLWIAVRDAYEVSAPGKFNHLVEDLLGVKLGEDENQAPQTGNIEILLSHCKMTIEMLTTKSATIKAEAAKSLEAPAFSLDVEIARLTSFVGIAEKAILKSVNFVSDETTLVAHNDLLMKLARRSPEKPRVRIFTTNYDLCIEEAALRLNAVLIDGFSHSARQRYNRDNFEHDIVRRRPSASQADYIDAVFHLYKMHGSVDWRRQREIVIRSMDADLTKFQPVLIYPRSSKYQEAFDAPYLDQFAAFQAALREPDTTIIISGFGFADDHISAPIWAALQSNLSLHLVLCDVAFIHDPKLDGGEHDIPLDMAGCNTHQKRILNLAVLGDRRVTILNGRFEDLTSAIPMIEGRTDRQRIEELIAAVNSAVPK
ncbi:SIR2 family protein [Neorhizobium sp. DAR64872/K0K18]|uniref:SIR2 family protein n=1 Tax=Neorhizobium sp. DAR64872/K0K18 TaxID=3421958 RepID=UPI003D290BBC